MSRLMPPLSRSYEITLQSEALSFCDKSSCTIIQCRADSKRARISGNHSIKFQSRWTRFGPIRVIVVVRYGTFASSSHAIHFISSITCRLSNERRSRTEMSHPKLDVILARGGRILIGWSCGLTLAPKEPGQYNTRPFDHFIQACVAR